MSLGKDTMSLDLQNLSREELLQLQQDVKDALRNAEARARQEARAAAEKAAAQYGFSLDEVTAPTVAPGKKKKKSIGAAKYRNPNNPEDTWTGRGRKPRWLIEALAAGVDISDLEI